MLSFIVALGLDQNTADPARVVRLRVFFPFYFTSQCRSLWRWCPGSPPLRPDRWSDPGWSAPAGRPRLPGQGPCHDSSGTEPGPPHTAADGSCDGPGSVWGRQTEGRHTYRGSRSTKPTGPITSCLSFRDFVWATTDIKEQNKNIKKKKISNQNKYS